MSSTAQRASILAVAAASLALPAVPVMAQADRTAVVDILIECAKIDDPTARLACYDNNMRRVGATPRATVPGQTVRGVVGGGAPIENEGPRGFGAEDIRGDSPARFQPRAGQVDEIHPKVTSVVARGNGIYIVTLDDGAVWEFAEGVTLQYRLPRGGDEIEIERGFGSSFLLRFDNQPAVPVRRVR